MRRLGNFAGVLLVVGYFLFAAIVLVLRYAILPNIDHYRPDLEALASHAVKQRVTIAAVRADWVGLRPRLTLTDLVVHDDAERIALKLPEVGATLAWESLSVLSLRLHTLRITSPELDIRRDADGRLSVGGILVDPSDRSTGEGLTGASRGVVRRPSRGEIQRSMSSINSYTTGTSSRDSTVAKIGLSMKKWVRRTVNWPPS